MRILITGTAGFIGYHLTKALLYANHEIVAIDSINDYYDTKLKFDRLEDLGIVNPVYTETHLSTKFNNLNFVYGNLENEQLVDQLFVKYKPEIVINLAAQAGVRYSITNPDVYVTANIVGFFNILNACKKYQVNKMIYASSSSIYGDQTITPFTEDMIVDKPISLYAATKKANELMAHTYSHLYGINTVGLRFFTVYGPYGRPDMAYFSFANSIMSGKEIEVFNEGNLSRDFTYIDDIVNGIMTIIDKLNSENSFEKYEIFNIGNSNPIKLMDFISTLETALNRKANLKFKPMQLGDVHDTYASVEKLKQKTNYSPSTTLAEGIQKFVVWYKSYFDVKEN
jgi:UDP-glucuronate 4-epimerase